MINVVVGGATGKLGKMVCEQIVESEDLKLIGAVVSAEGGNVGKELFPGVIASSPTDLKKVLENADVYVDLTTPSAAAKIVCEIPATGTNLVLGTTAVPADVLDKMRDLVKTEGTSALISANFSIGVNVFWKVCEILAKYLPEYDIEVVEAHHNAKKDAPSGTALEAVRRLKEATDVETVVCGREGVPGPRGREIGVHSIRAGDIIGDHTVILAKNLERVELTHKAISREAIARGCVESIRWISGRKDGLVHNMDEVLDL